MAVSWAQLTKLKLETSCKEFDKDSTIPTSHVRLPGLRLLEVSLVFAMMFSWFTAPLLEHLHIHGCTDLAYDWLYDDQPYEREITSLIQRSSCHVRQLVLDNLMKALASVEELSITYPRGTLNVLQDITGCIYMPKMQVLQVRPCIIRGNLAEKVEAAASRLFEARGKGSSLPSHDIAPLEKFVIWLTLRGTLKFFVEVLEVMRSWPSFAQVYINGTLLERLTPSL
ncbi:hypothetical protein F5887DRAFT_975937 [Amanita rubescens]|nr:hypothetical protein F5887DRAFT_975937 [Amanita rubescens]